MSNSLIDRIKREYNNLEVMRPYYKNTEKIDFAQSVLERIAGKMNKTPRKQFIYYTKDRELVNTKNGKITQLSKNESKIIELLAIDNYISKEDIADKVYETQLDDYMKKSIGVAIYRLNKIKGVNIKAKYNCGYILQDKITIKN